MFSSDPRLKVEMVERRDDVGVWVLRISKARKSDQGLYQCQVSYSLLGIFELIFGFRHAGVPHL